jgi:Protein of unknown function (DUF3237)
LWLRAELGPLLDFGDTAAGHRRVVPILGGSFEGPDLIGEVVPGSADWQLVGADGTIAVNARYTLRTDRGELVLVDSRGTRHGPPEVLERLGRGEAVAPSDYTFRTAVRIETSAPRLQWMERGVFVAVAARAADAVEYDLYLVG